MTTLVKVLSPLAAACSALLLAVAASSIVAIWPSSVPDPYHPVFVVIPAWLFPAFALVFVFVVAGVALAFRTAKRQGTRVPRLAVATIVLSTAAWASVGLFWAVANSWV